MATPSGSKNPPDPARNDPARTGAPDSRDQKAHPKKIIGFSIAYMMTGPTLNPLDAQ